MSADRNRQILLVETPQGKLEPRHFRQAESDIPSPAEGQILVRTRYLSLDAANRAWMQGATYRSAVEAGTVMAGGSISEVVESRDGGFAKGDLVFADTGWQDYAVLHVYPMYAYKMWSRDGWVALARWLGACSLSSENILTIKNSQNPRVSANAVTEPAAVATPALMAMSAVTS